MRKIVLALVLSLVGAGLSAPADAEPRLDSVRVWNELGLVAVRATRATDADAARTYAMLNVAIYDAVNGLAGPARAHALIPGPGPRGADPHAAAVAAAHAILVRLDPDRTATYDTQLRADLAGLRPGHRRDAGVRWGGEVGQRVVASRADDGSTPVQSQPAGSGPGAFRAEWSGVQYRNVRPFAVANPAAYVPGPPPALDSLDYAAAFAEVALLGDAGIPAPDKLATFQFWSVPAGTGQPAGEWVKIALTVSRGQPLPTSARLMALLTMTLADSTVPTVGTKFNHRHWRPATAIREAETDGNPLTQPNPSWAPRAGSTGGTPEYPSGHSSYSGAAATVLAGFFCADNVRFTHTTDTAPGGQARSYPGFSAAAAEAGRSRVFGGQHFEFSNQAGLAIGRNVATEVLANRLLKRTGPTHHGHCPL
ncbi:vanadium-dependent haloperoxidase [Lentzea tibetensis]|uniref:Vanadium-dependent haloperoxidase n=1 Tax=Lentzea tibetensis TaxID=2591470 RepID=A0A563ELM9_9PSEU|nr:vanadium-dependent haloperoxidase [Lentzea tibetensis]TWP47973.1 vanadium-dependent haloperoxidase [Lentzea tibetensis]